MQRTLPGQASPVCHGRSQVGAGDRQLSSHLTDKWRPPRTPATGPESMGANNRQMPTCGGNHLSAVDVEGSCDGEPDSG
jgi:hypothetical protein